jgi:hypothetical protein
MTNKTKYLGSQIGYQGKINVKLLQNNKTISTRTYHNSGLSSLFFGLSKIFAGASDASMADVIPTYLELYSVTNSQSLPSKLRTGWSTLAGDEEIIPAAALLPITNRRAEGNVVTCELKIPLSLITAESIYLMALYPQNITSRIRTQGNTLEYRKGALAYYKLLDDFGWDPIIIDHVNYDYNLLIEWQMTFNNAGGKELEG